MVCDYDLCVIGAGLIGSAAARHASQNSNVKVCLIGPSEPKISIYLFLNKHLRQLRADMALTSLLKHTVSPGPSMFADAKYNGCQ